MKLINPQDAQAWNGAGLCGSNLNDKSLMTVNFGTLESNFAPETAKEWAVLAEVQEISSFVYKETVLNSFRNALKLDPTNGIYGARLWSKIGVHGYNKDWQHFQHEHSDKSENAKTQQWRLDVTQQRNSLNRIAAPHVQNKLDSYDIYSLSVQQNFSLARLDDMQDRYANIRQVCSTLERVQ